MTTGEIILDRFNAQVFEGEVTKNDAEGKPTDEKQPVKILQTVDLDTGFKVRFVFGPDQFDQFADHMRKAKSKLIHLPGRALFTRNGGIKG